MKELREKGYKGHYNIAIINFQFCIWIDEEAFQSILNAPEPEEGRWIKKGKYDYIGFVKVITLYESSSRNEEWARVDFRYLWWVYDDDEIERKLRTRDPQ